MKLFRRLFYILFSFSFIIAGVQWQIDQSTIEKLVIHINFDVKTQGDLEPFTLLIGLPNNELPALNVRGLNKRKNPFIIENDNGGVRWINQQKVRMLETATLEVNPSIGDNYYYENFIIEISLTPSSKTLVSANK